MAVTVIWLSESALHTTEVFISPTCAQRRVVGSKSGFLQHNVRKFLSVNTKPILSMTLCLVFTVGAYAQDKAKEDSPKKSETAGAATCSIQGRVTIPDDVSEVINTEGLTLDKVVVTLKGKGNYPRTPYPSDWKEMKPKERSEWYEAFLKSEEYQDHRRKMEAAEAKRETYTTELDQDGLFTFAGIKPAWYELTAVIMHPDAKDSRSVEYARGRAMNQFFVKQTGRPHRAEMKLKLKNVLVPGDVAPDWTITAYDGGEITLSDFRGKFVLFDIWATWCGPCRAEFPNLEAVYEDFGGERFEMIGISVDEAIDAPRSLLAKAPSPYLQGWVGGLKRHEQIAEAYGFQSIPSIWLIGPDGKIVARDLIGKSLREAVKAAIEGQADKE